MRQFNDYNEKRVLYIIKIMLTIFFLGGIVNHSLYAKNEDTPNLDFSKGTWEGWTRYYGYYGPINMLTPANGNVVSNSLNTRDVGANDVWTLKDDQISGTSYGMFEIISSSSNDNNLACDNLKLVPEGSTHTARIGNMGFPEIYATTDGAGYWYRRAMAERMTYSFVVTENSTLLTYKYATIIQKDASHSENHDEDGMAPFSVKITANNNALCNSMELKSSSDLKQASIIQQSGTYQQVCTKYGECTNYSSTQYYFDSNLSNGGVKYKYYYYQWGRQRTGYYEDYDNAMEWSDAENCYKLCQERECLEYEKIFIPDNKAYPCYQSNLTQDVLKQMYYKDWTTIVYDLRDYIGQTVTIDVRNRDCLEQNWVCGACNVFGTELTNFNSSNTRANCSKCNTSRPVNKRTMAGFHRTYGYFTAETSKMELTIQNCGDGSNAKITAPEGFASYVWKDPAGNALATESGRPNVAIVPNGSIQPDKDYTCTMQSADPDCEPIEEKFRLNNPPISMEFSADVACYNEVQFTDLSKVLPVTIDGEEVVYDSIVNRVWSYYEDGKLVEVAEKDPLIQFNCKGNSTCTYNVTLTIWTANDCKREITRPITVTPRPDVELVGDDEVCFGYSTPIELKNYIGNNNTYYWLNESGDILSSGNSSEDRIYMAKPTNGTATYTLRIEREESSNNGKLRTCRYIGEHNITVLETPTVAVTADNTYFPTIDGNVVKAIDICLKADANLKASSNMNCDFAWYENESSKKQTGTNETTSTYKHTVSDETKIYVEATSVLNQCKAYDSIYIKTLAIPEIEIEGPDEICAGTPTKYSATGDSKEDSYVWTTAEGNNFQMQAISVTIPETQDGTSKKYTYSVKGVGANGCSNTVEKEIEVFNLPILSVSGSTQICEGGEISLSITGADTTRWDNGKELKGGEPMVDTPDNTRKSYLVYGYKNNKTARCQTNIEIPITINSNPNILITGITDICEGGEVTLTASGANRYEWNDPQKTNGVVMKDKPDSETTYIVKGYTDIKDVTPTLSCVGENEVTVRVHSAPQFTLTATPEKVCEGDLTTITPVAGDGYEITSYHWDNGAQNNTLTTSVHTTQTFGVTATDRYGCTKQNSIKVETKPYPILTITEGGSICENGEATITIEGADEYTWEYGDEKGTVANVVNKKGTFTHHPKGTGEVFYYITGTTDGCSTKNAQAKITISEAPAIAITGYENGVCLGGSVTLTASGSANGKYVWLDSNGQTIKEGTDDGSDKLTLTPDKEGSYVYTVKGYDEINCEGKATITLEVYQNPVLTITANENNSNCIGTNVELTVSGKNTNTFNWTLKDENNNSLGDASGASLRIPLQQSTQFYVEGTDINGCKGTTNTTIVAKPYPTFNIKGKDYVCQGEKSVTLTVEGTTGTTYEWTRNENITSGESFTENDVKYDGSSYYNVKVSGTLDGCKLEQDYKLNIVTPPNIYISGNNVYCEGEEVKMTAKGGIEGKYIWNNNNSSTADSYETIATPTVTQFSVTGQDSKGCSNTATFNITVKSAPNVQIKVPETTEICKESTIKLEVEGANTYTWEEVKGENSSDYACTNCASINPQIDTDVTYIVTGKDVEGCLNTDTINITAKEIPEITISGENIVCMGAQVKLTAQNTNANTEISKWEWSEVEDENDKNSLTLTIDELNEKRSFTVTATTAAGCEKQASKEVDVYTPQSIGIDNGVGYVCMGGKITINAIGDSNLDYTWKRSDDASWSAQGKSVTIDNITSNFDIHLSAKDGKNCVSNADSKEIISNPLPSIKITADNQDGLCEGSSVKLTAIEINNTSMQNGGWEWYDADKTLLNNKVGTLQLNNITKNTTYYAKGTDINGCQSEFTKYDIEVLATPSVTITGPDTICKNGEVTLQVNTDSNNKITWNNGKNSATINETLTIAKEYNFTATISNASCSTTVYKKVVVNDNPQVTLTSVNGKSSVCEDDSITIQANTLNDVTYTWENSNSTKDVATYRPTGSNNINCKVTVTEKTTKCQSSANFNVTVNKNPTLYINDKTNGTSSVCEGDNISLIATGLSTKNYDWYADNVVVGGSDNYHPNVLKKTVYSIIGSDENGCKGSATYTVDIKPFPTFEVANSTICSGEEAIIEVKNSTAKKHTWKWDGGSYEGKENETIYKENLTASKVYTLLGELDGCITPVGKSVTVTVKALPTITIESNPLSKEICLNESIKLSALGGENGKYEWEAGEYLSANNNNEVTITPSAIGEYTYKVKGEKDKCTNFGTIKIKVNNLPTVAINADYNSICIGESVTLNASGAESYVWSSGSSTWNGASISPIIEKKTEFSLVGTDDKGCTSNAEKITIDTKTKPEVSWEKVEVCEGGNANITINGAETILWKEDGRTTNNQRTFENVTEEKTYQIKVSKNGCEKDTFITIYVNKLPVISLTNNLGKTNAVCKGDVVEIKATAENCNFTWKTGTDKVTIEGNNNESLSYQPTTEEMREYKVIATNTKTQCVDSTTYTYNVNNNPTNEIEGTNVVCINRTIQLGSKNKNFNTYSWSEKSNINYIIGTLSDIEVAIDSDKTYSLIISDQNGCRDTSEFSVTAVAYPTFDIQYDKVCATSTGKVNLINVIPDTAKISWSWNGGTANNVKSVEKELNESTEFTVNVYIPINNINRCETIKTFEATVHDAPNFTIQTNKDNDEICEGESITLTASDESYEYQWKEQNSSESDIKKEQSITVSPTGTVTYEAIATNAENCTTKVLKEVIVNKLPNLTIQKTGAACPGNTVLVEVSGSDNIKWYNKEQIEISNSSNKLSIKIAEEGNTDTTFYVVGTSKEGCSVSDKISITKLTKPDLEFSGDLVICENNIPKVTVSGASTYEWYDGDKLIGGGNTLPINQELTETKSYKVIGSDGENCSSEETVTITVNKNPSVYITAANTDNISKTNICLNDSVELTAHADNVTFNNWENGKVFATGKSIGNKTYTVNVTEKTTNCPGTATYEVNTLELPAVKIVASESSVCEGKTITLTSNDEYKTYQWYTYNGEEKTVLNSNIGSWTQTLTTTTQYILDVTDLQGCANSDTTQIVAKPYPVVTFEHPAVCSGTPGKITVKETTADEYSWPNNGEVSENVWTTTENLTNKKSFTITVGKEQCYKTHSLEIEVKDKPNLSITVNGKETNGNSVEICTNDDVTLGVTSDNKTLTQYEWVTTEGKVSEAYSFTTKPTNNTIYTVKATDSEYCINQKNQSIIINTPQLINIAGENSVCENGNVTLTATGSKNYNWNITPAQGATIKYNSDDKSSVTLQNITEDLTIAVDGVDNKGCSNSEVTHTITVTKKPTLTITSNKNGKMEICSGETITLTANGGENTSIKWNNNPTEGKDFTTPTLNSTEKKNYTYGVSYYYGNNNSCVADSNVSITVNPLPIVQITGEIAICEGNKSTLTASELYGNANMKFSWTNFEEGKNPIEVSESGTYKVTGKDQITGCISQEKEYNVTKYNNPINVTISAEEATCKDSTITLVAKSQNKMEYEWYLLNADNEKTHIGTGTSIEQTLSKDEKYLVEAAEPHTLSNGQILKCYDTIDYSVSVIEAPDFYFDAKSICYGQNLTININGPETAEYTWNNSSTTGKSYTDNEVTEAKKYSVTAQLNGCSRTKDTTVTINALPVINTLNAEESVCLNSEIQITSDCMGNGELTYNWSTNKDQNSIKGATNQSMLTVVPSTKDERTYYLEISDKNDCSTKDSIIVGVKTLPTIEINGDLIVCKNSDIALEVKNGLTFNWYKYDNTTNQKGDLLLSGSGSDLFTQTITKNQSFYLEVENNDGCKNSKIVDVTINELPEIEWSGKNNICYGKETDITFIAKKPGDIYRVYVDNNTIKEKVLSMKFSPTTTTKYKIEVESNNNCVNEGEIEITVNALPEVTINGVKEGSSNVCLNSEIKLGAGSNIDCNFSWNTNSTDDTITVKANTLEGFTAVLVGKDKINQCVDSAKFDIVGIPLPTVVFEGEDKKCKGETAKIIVKKTSPNYNYLWVDNNSTEEIRNIVIDKDTTLKVIVSDNSTQCSNIGSFNIKKLDFPKLNITPSDTTVCLGDSVKFNISYSGILYWDNEVITTKEYKYQVNENKTITVIAEDYECKTNKDVTVNYYDLPIVEIENVGLACDGKTKDIVANVTSGSTPYQFTWEGEYSSQNGNKITTKELTTSNNEDVYKVIVQDKNKCIGTAETTLEVVSNPTIEISVAKEEVCDNETATLTASGAGNEGTYLWNTNENGAIITPIIDSEKSFSVIGTDHNGCSGKSEIVTIKKKELPELIVSGEKEICIGDSTTITLSAKDRGTAKFYWIEDSEIGQYSKAIEGATRKLSPTERTMYKVRVEDNGCSIESEFYIDVNTLPEIKIISSVTDNTLCLGEKITLIATDNLNNYQWTNKNNNEEILGTNNQIVITPKELAEYKVVAEDAKGCINSDSLVVNVNQRPKIQLVSEDAACKNSTLVLTAKNVEGYPAATTYNWGTLSMNEKASVITTTHTATTTYQVIATAQNGCKDTAAHEVKMIELPYFELTNNSPLCYGNNVEISIKNADKTYTYTWPSNGEVIGEGIWREKGLRNSNINNYQYGVTGTITTNVNNKIYSCSTEVVTSVKVNELPSINILGTTFICKEDAKIDLSVTGPNDVVYVWSAKANSGTIEKSNEGNNAIATPTDDTKILTYYVVGTDKNSCSTKDSISIERVVGPEFKLETENLMVCYGEDVDLVISSDDKYIKEVKWGDGDNSRTKTIKNVIENKTYTATASSEKGCTAEKTFNIEVKSLPEPTLDYPKSICYNEIATINISETDKIEWENTEYKKNLSIDKTITNNTEFDITAIAVYSDGQKQIECKKDFPIVINMNELPKISFNGEDEICENQIIEIEAIGENTSEPYSYNWGNSITENKFKFTAHDDTTLTVVVTDGNNCSNSAEHNIVVNPQPEFTVKSVVVCDGAIAKLEANNKNLKYRWNDGDYIDNTFETAAITGPTKVKVIAKDSKECTSETEVEIGWKPMPKLEITGEDAVCYNSEVELRVSDTSSPEIQTSYVWNKQNNENKSIFVSDKITAPKTFTVVGTKNGCIDSTHKTVSIYNLPTIGIGGELEVCEGESITLVGSGGLKYKWNDPDGTYADQEGANDSYKYEADAQNTNVTVWGIDGNGCENSNTASITINKKPEFTIKGDSIACYNSEIVLTAKKDNSTVGNLVYEWKDKNDKIVSTDDYLRVTVTKDTTFTITGQSSKGCTKSQTFSIKVKYAPTIEIVEYAENVCKGSVTTITLKNNASQIYWEDNLGNILSNKETVTKEINNNTQFNVYLTNNYPLNNGMLGCKKDSTFVVNIWDLPYVQIGGSNEVCLGDSVDLTATGDFEYVWVNVTEKDTLKETTQTINVKPVATTNYKVIATNQNGCSNEFEKTIIVNSLPKFELASNENEVCIGNSINIRTSNQKLLYNWDGNGYQSIFNHTYTIDSPKKIVVYAMDNDTKCENRDSIEIGVKEYPTINIDAPDYICVGNSAQIKGLNDEANYTWREDNENGETKSSESSFTISNIEADKQIYATIEKNGCTTDTSFIIRTWSLPNVKIEGSPSISLCYNETIGLKVSGANEYVWNNDENLSGENYQTPKLTDETKVKVLGKDVNGCINQDSITIYINDLPQFNIEGDNEVCIGNKAEINTTNDGLSYIWKNKDGEVISTQQYINPTITKDTTFYVTGTNALGCSSSQEHTITTNAYPVITTVVDSNIVCKGETAYIEVTTDIPSTYIWNNNSTLNENKISQEVQEQTTFVVEATSIDGNCTSVANYTVSARELPTLLGSDVTICKNEKAILTASSSSEIKKYTWLGTDSIGNQFTTPSISQTTTYTVVGEDIFGCKGEKEIAIYIYELPKFTLSNEATVCKNAVAEISASNPTLKYDWGSGYKTDTKQSIIVEKDTTISVWAMDENGCISEGSTAIRTKELPILKFELPSDHVCLGENITLKVSGAIDGYLWMNGAESESITLENVTSYQEVKVQGTTNGCTSEIDTTINVWNLPTITIEATTDYICAGDSIELTATGGIDGKYKWESGETSNSIVVKPTYNQSTYKVVGKDQNGCTNSTSKEIVIHDLPRVVIEGINEICRGDHADLLASGTSDFYVWTTIEGTKKDTIGTTTTISPKIDKDEITFYVEGKDAYGCVGYDQYVVKAKEYPTLTHRTSTGKDSVCKGSMLKIEVDGADTYVWQNGSTSTFMETKLMNPTKYSVDGTTNGCTTSLQINIGIWQLPEFSIEGERAVCAGGEITLNAVPTIGGTKYNYVWEDLNETTESITQKLETPNTTITYKTVATDVNQCKNYKVHTVKVNPLPTDITISGETLICVGGETTLTASGSAIDYLWSNGTSSNEITPTITTKDSTFAVTGTDVNGCQYTTDITVKTKEYPTLKIDYPEYVCMGDSATIVVSGATDFVWEDTKDSNPIRKEKIDTDTKFVIEGTINGCTTREEFTVRVWSLPSIWISTTDTDNEICKNESITLVASGGVSGKYIWNNDATQTQDELTVSPSENQTYTIVGEDENGCRSGNSFEVIVNDLPTVVIEGNSLICAGDNVELEAITTGNAIKSYSWNNGEAEKKIDVSVKEDSEFAVHVEDVNGCTAKTTYTVATKPYPELTYNAPKHICIGENVAVTVNGATTYKWEDAPQLFANNFIDTPSKDTVYKVSGTTNNCTSYLEIPLLVMPLPEIWISSANNEICKNTSIQLTANGGASYQWNTKGNTQSIEVSPTATTEYKVIGTDSYGCIGEATKTIVVNELPEFKIFGESQICEGNNTMLWVEGNATRYTWTNTGEQGDTIYPTINKSTTFTVLAENVHGCTRMESKTVASKPYPVLNYTAPEALCEGETLEIIVNGADSYKWQDGSTSNQYTETLYSNSTYSVEGTTNGCTTREQFSVNVLPLPYVWITGSSDICYNDRVTLDAKGAATYIWGTGDRTSSITTTPRDTTTYIVTGTDVNGCSTTTDFKVNVHPLPTIAIDGEDAVCDGESVQLTASGTANEFRWNTGQEGISIHPIITKTEIFKVVGTDEFGCVNEVTKEVVKKPNPLLIFNAPTAVCYGSTAKIIVSGADEFVWQDGKVGREYIDTPENMTTYSVIGTTNGCSTQQNFQIDVLPLPTIWISGASEICENAGIKLTASGGLSYEWNTGLKSAELYANPTTTTTYEVNGKDVNGCINTKSYTVKVNPVPNFTIEGPSQVCKGDAANLSVKGDEYKYTWNTGAITPNISPIVTENSTFTVEAINSFGCTTKKNHNVLSVPYPTLIYNGPRVVCTGSKVQLAVIGADTYLWGDSVKGNKLVVYPEANTTYTVKGESKGCYSELNIPIETLQRPTLTYQGKTNICEGDLLSLTVHGANSYTWNNGNNSNKLETYQKSSVKYIVEGKDDKGCTNEIAIDVTVNPAPIFEIIGKDEVCKGHETELIAKGDATTYQWGFGTSDFDDYESANGAPVKVTINTPTYIFVNGIHSNGCQSRQYKTITTKESPKIYFEGDTSICFGESATLKGLGGDSYIWKINNQVVGSDHVFSFVPEGNTRIVLTGTLDDCTSDTEIRINPKALPSTQIVDKNIAICQDQLAVLTARGADEYEWSTGETGETISHTLKNDEQFIVTGKTKDGCTSKDTVYVKVHNLPKIELSKQTFGCTAEETEVIVKATGAKEYSWRSEPYNSDISGDISDSIIAIITEPTTIYVSGTDSNKCVGEKSVSVDTVQTKHMKFNITPTTVEATDPRIKLEGISPNNDQWIWYAISSIDNKTIEGRTSEFVIEDAINKNEVIFKIYAKDENGCEFEGDTVVYIWKDFWAPNAFTPNNDGRNDKFRFLGCEYITEIEFTIYDRTGKIVYEGRSTEDVWDGTHNGEECPWGVYGYVVKYVSDYKDIHKEGVKKGEVTLIR